MFSRITHWLKGVMSRMFKFRNDTRITGGVRVAVSTEMAQAIQTWYDMYIGKAPWLVENDQTLNLPAVIASEMATLVTLEAKISIAGSKRAEYLNEQFIPVVENLHTNVEYACAMGGIVMKPYPDNGGIAIDYIHVDDFYPIAFNGRKEITSAVFVERKHIGEKIYSRVEFHKIEDKSYTITNDCYCSININDLGEKASLKDVDEWNDIEPVTTISDIDFPLFAYFRIPLGNSIDPKSPLGVSVYAKAEKNIMEADKQYQRMIWEFKGGELAIDAPEDAFDYDENQEPILPEGKERLFRLNQLDPKHGGDSTFKTFSPTLRDASIINGMNEILSKIEDQTGLARGTISDRIKDTRTATEIKFSRQRTYATVTAIQTSLGNSINGLIRAMDAIATLYNLAPAGDYEVSCKWDDSVVTDADTERMRDLQEIRDGIMQKWEYRVKWYGEDAETAKRMAQSADESDDEIMGFSNGVPNLDNEKKGDENDDRKL